MSSAFFYGTLMHPRILRRVIGNDGTHLHICPAVLLNYTRHKVKDEDYPGIIPYTVGRDAFFDGKEELDRNACSVRGTMVTGLTPSDIDLFDIFEGNEYTRLPVSVHPLSALLPLADYTVPAAASATPLPPDAELNPAEEVDTYVYRDPTRLMPDIWDFDHFIAQNAWKWYGDEARSNPYYTEVDRRQAGGTTAVAAN